MNIENLIKRLRKASVELSLRKLGRECDVSHELIRKLINSGKTVPGLTVANFQKIDTGLSKNGY